MARQARKLSSTLTYHVIVRGADRQLLFEETKDYLKFLDFLQLYKEKYEFEIFAYCLMSNHVHLLLRHPETVTLESIFRSLNSSYASWFNHKYQRTGFLFGGRYYSEPVESDQYLLTVLKYIHFNPTKAYLESKPGESYHWTSYYDYEFETANLTDISPVMKILENKQAFWELHSKTPDEECLEIPISKNRITDDIIKELIQVECSCNCVSDFQELPLSLRNKHIIFLKEKGATVKQINRLTGTPRGVIERIISKRH